MKRNPVRARARLDSAPGSHPRETPQRGFRERIAEKEETLLLAARLRSALGDLDYARTMRLVIPGATLTTLAVQTAFSSFFVSVLGMGRR